MAHGFRMGIAGLVFFASAACAGETMTEDFEGTPEDRWRFIEDRVMGGVSSGQMTFQSEEGDAFARLEGAVSTENNGGFIQMRRALEGPPPDGATGVRLVVRGNAERYFVHLRSEESLRPWYFFQAGFPVTEDWSEVRLPFEAFQPSRRFSGAVSGETRLTSIAVVAYGRDHKARVDVREIGFY